MESHNYSTFSKVVESEVAKFPSVELCRKLDEKRFVVRDYHQYLKLVFHQSFNGPSTFALAAAHCGPEKYRFRDYFIKHAEEERYHYEWIIEDLKRTGYKGTDIRVEIPEPNVLSYLAFNFFVSTRYPAARLGPAAVLEGIGAKHARKYGTLICQQLGFDEKQVVFTLGHSDTDVTHTDEMHNLLKSSDLTEFEWRWLEKAATTSAELYRRMYNGQ